MRKIFYVDGKKAVVDTKLDEKIYSAPANPPNTGTRYTNGTDIYFHVCKDGREVFYAYDWTMWQGTEEVWRVIDRAEVEAYIIDQIGGQYTDPSERELTKLEELGFNFFEEE